MHRSSVPFLHSFCFPRHSFFSGSEDNFLRKRLFKFLVLSLLPLSLVFILPSFHGHPSLLESLFDSRGPAENPSDSLVFIALERSQWEEVLDFLSQPVVALLPLVLSSPVPNKHQRHPPRS